MHEIVILSGKGGTGKTTITGSFAALCDNKVLADCDVDAANLHLLLKPTVKKTEEFWCGQNAVIDANQCMQCALCEEICRFNAINDFKVDHLSCEGCGFCKSVCPINAIEMSPDLAGYIYTSDTDYGKMVHAKLGIGQDNSGKLVTEVKRRTRAIAEQNNCDFIICDGSPGIGCPVISSLAGADLALLVVEPTLSGIHDMERVLDVCFRFKTNTMVCINKYDINRNNTALIKSYCNNLGVQIAGEIPFDNSVTKSLLSGKTVVEASKGKAAKQIISVWHTVSESLKSCKEVKH